jgi:SAM-dependent methyltransferase
VKTGVYAQLDRTEGNHWWFEYRRRLVLDFLDRRPPPSWDRVLDLGCGTGGNLDFLDRLFCRAYGVDLSQTALSFARTKYSHGRLIQGDANRIGSLFAPNTFDVVTVFNVLYHQRVASERDVLQQVRRLLRPGGCLLLTEPAFPILTRRHDMLDFGKTRYRIREMRSMMGEAGFVDLEASYFNSISFPPALLLAVRDRLAGSHEPRASDTVDEAGEMKVLPGWANKAVFALLELERRVIRLFGSIPLGVTLLCIGRKPA